MKKNILSLLLLCSAIAPVLSINAGWFSDDRTAAQKMVDAIMKRAKKGGKRVKKEGKKFVKYLPSCLRRSFYSNTADKMVKCFDPVVETVLNYAVRLPLYHLVISPCSKAANFVVNFFSGIKTSSKPGNNGSISHADAMKLITLIEMLQHENAALKKAFGSKEETAS